MHNIFIYLNIELIKLKWVIFLFTNLEKVEKTKERSGLCGSGFLQVGRGNS